GRPVETVETPIDTPLRYTRARCSDRLTTTTSGPFGAASAYQMNWPGFSVFGSVPMGSEAFAPQNGTVSPPRCRIETRSANATARLRRKRVSMAGLPWDQPTPFLFEGKTGAGDIVDAGAGIVQR